MCIMKLFSTILKKKKLFIFTILVVVSLNFKFNYLNKRSLSDLNGIHFNKTITNLLAKNKVKSFSIITIANYGFRKFALNWILNLKRLDFNKFIVFCFDTKVFDYLKAKGYANQLLMVPDEWLDAKLAANYTNFNTNDYNNIVRAKSHVWFQMLKHNHHILYSDPDVVNKFLILEMYFYFFSFFYSIYSKKAWLNKNIVDHLEFLIQYSSAQALFSRDFNQFNTGFFVVKSTPFTIKLFL